MRKLILAAAFAATAALAGCATVESVITGSTVNPNYAYAAVQSFNAAETTADSYLKLPACVSGGSTACRNATAAAAIVPAIRTARTARNALVAALHASNGGAVPVASYNTLQSAIDVLNSIYTNYGVAAPATK